MEVTRCILHKKISEFKNLKRRWPQRAYEKYEALFSMQINLLLLVFRKIFVSSQRSISAAFAIQIAKAEAAATTHTTPLSQYRPSSNGEVYHHLYSITSY
jgi:hypothetical protein